MPPRPPDHGPPLDVAEAHRRAAQLHSLTDPVRLLILSHLARQPDHVARASDLAGELGIPAKEVTGHLATLAETNLVTQVGGGGEPTVTLSHEAWARFRRIIAPRLDAEHHQPVGVPRLEPEIDWSRYPTVVRRIAQQLTQRFRTTFSRNTIEKYVADSYDELASRSRVNQHLPMLTNRLTTDRLSALAAARGLRLRPVPDVLFVCVHNSGRSQIASAILRHLAGELITVRSAGTEPAQAVDPVVRQALAEMGMSEFIEAPRRLSDDMVRAADVVVTLGCGDACPLIPGRRYFDWPIEDPAGLHLDQVRSIRAEIQRRVESLLIELGIDPPPSSP